MAVSSSSLGIMPASESAVALTITMKRIAFLLVRVESRAGRLPTADSEPWAGFYAVVERATEESTGAGKKFQRTFDAANRRRRPPH
ncbi:conserved protein of unknown function [Ectopseudomonas oleovorans]|uniref:Uncharacterized protein n=1 Tax=Ectopseudomonas oleovorans TaxID=301 RepID=A0A653AZD8_ECTOL|nr:conserved protein of unknown function [Pseudomonas oleovorans]